MASPPMSFMIIFNMYIIIYFEFGFHNIKYSGVGGQVGDRHHPPPAETLLPLPPPPNEITLCTEVYGEPPFWVPGSPPVHPWAPLPVPSF